MGPLFEGFLVQKQKLNVRLPVGLHQRLGFVAEEYGLSMNAMAVLAVDNYVGYVETHRRLPGGHSRKHRPVPEPVPPVTKPGRNEPCHCGSGRKYKQCHYPN